MVGKLAGMTAPRRAAGAVLDLFHCRHRAQAGLLPPHDGDKDDELQGRRALLSCECPWGKVVPDATSCVRRGDTWETSGIISNEMPQARREREMNRQ